MQVNRVPAGWGFRWIREGLGLVRKGLLPLTMLTLAYLFVLMALTLIPVVGPAAPLIVVPSLSVGLMVAVRETDQGASPKLMTLLAGLREYGSAARNRLLSLGLINAATTLLALAAAASADDGTLMKLATGAAEASDLEDVGSEVLWASAIFLTLYLPAQMALWFAPLFISWHRLGVGQALFFSFFTVWRNRSAFAVFLFGWFGLALLASLVLQIIKALAPETPMLISAVLTPLSLILMTGLYASYWPSYRDSVHHNPQPSGGGIAGIED